MKDWSLTSPKGVLIMLIPLAGVGLGSDLLYWPSQAAHGTGILVSLIRIISSQDTGCPKCPCLGMAVHRGKCVRLRLETGFAREHLTSYKAFANPTVWGQCVPQSKPVLPTAETLGLNQIVLISQIEM